MKKKERKKTLLWQVMGEELPGPSFVFGTMHVRDRRAFRYRERVYACIERCDALATEFHLEALAAQTDPALLQLPPGLTIDQLMRPRQYEKLRRILRKAVQVDIEYLKHLRPLIISNLIDERILARDQPLALDEHLWNYARDRGKILLGIETFEEQAEVLRSIPLDYEVASLLWTGRHIRRHRRQLLRMTELYQKGDIYQLYRSAKAGAHDLRKLLLYRRNYIMADRIAPLLREQTTVCAIGAGHLAGEKGVLRLLKRQGFRVTPESF